MLPLTMTAAAARLLALDYEKRRLRKRLRQSSVSTGATVVVQEVPVLAILSAGVTVQDVVDFYGSTDLAEDCQIVDQRGGQMGTYALLQLKPKYDFIFDSLLGVDSECAVLYDHVASQWVPYNTTFVQWNSQNYSHFVYREYSLDLGAAEPASPGFSGQIGSILLLGG